MQFLTRKLREVKEFREIDEAVSNGKFPMAISGLSAIHKVVFLYALRKNEKALYIVPDEYEMQKAFDDFCSLGINAVVFPARDFNPRSNETHSKEYEQKRLGTLSKIIDGAFDVCIATVSSCCSRTVPREILEENTFVLKSGDTLDEGELFRKLVFGGYTRVDEVESVGQYAVRGGIIDIFPPSQNPVRIDLWGDEIDSLKTFNVFTARSENSIESVKITPVKECIFSSVTLAENLRKSIEGRVRHSDIYRETVYRDIDKINGGLPPTCDRYLDLIYDEFTTLFDYFNGLVFVSEYSSCIEKLNSALTLQKEDFKVLLEDGLISKKARLFCLDTNKFTAELTNNRVVFFDTFTKQKFGMELEYFCSVTLKGTLPFNLSAKVLLDEIPEEKNALTVILAGNEKAAKNLNDELTERGINSVFTPDYSKIGSKGIFVTVGGLSSGFYTADNSLCLITHGIVTKRQKPRFKKGADIGALENLKRGDYVVHLTHGIGEFDGVQPITSQGVTKDYIKIKYLGKDVLYVPVTSLDMVSKYIGSREDSNVKLNRLGSASWKNARARVKRAVKDIAKELTELYAKRMRAKGFAFFADDDMQRDFESRFNFNETEDQLRSVAEIKRDMEKPFPMDRLLCGDVGFGKTEVALRAAFKCIASGKQCAILVPTTILAWQHFNTAIERFSHQAVNIEMISRFRTAKQQEKIKKDLKAGNIDLIIGTHRLVSSDIKFRDLGLLIVDEEQRFGVGQKEKLKELFPEVDVLTLSATPIPRTLNMALSGIRDMSSIEEAPLDRYPVQTYVTEKDNGVIAEAINKELRRQGQVFYLYNRTDSIERRALEIGKLVPGARIAVAHGKMNEEDLSKVWKAMLENEIDVLVCTTIIETGVDVTNANTLIIENADRLGLSQLHQIRGRVGRSNRRAFAYLLFERDKALSEVSQKRLNAIKEFTEFGSGFKIAMRDLEIRGAGNILGGEQHGHMEAVGYSLYLQMLADAVNEEKGVKSQEKQDCLVDIKLNSHIPESYISALPQRISMYRRIAAIETEADYFDVTDELIDRYGDIPKSVLELLEISLIRAKAVGFGISEIAERNGILIFKWREFNPAFVGKFLEKYGKNIRFEEANSPTVKVQIGEKEAPLSALKEVMDLLAK